MNNVDLFLFTLAGIIAVSSAILIRQFLDDAFGGQR